MLLQRSGAYHHVASDSHAPHAPRTLGVSKDERDAWMKIGAEWRADGKSATSAPPKALTALWQAFWSLRHCDVFAPTDADQNTRVVDAHAYEAPRLSLENNRGVAKHGYSRSSRRMPECNLPRRIAKMEALAASVIAMITPYLVKGGEAFASEVGKAAFNTVSDLMGRLKMWWNSDPVAEATAGAIAQDPQLNGKRLGGMLDDAFAADPSFAEDVRSLLKAVGPDVTVIQNMKIANGVTGADVGRMVGGRIAVSQTMDEATNTTGFRSDVVGG